MSYILNWTVKWKKIFCLKRQILTKHRNFSFVMQLIWFIVWFCPLQSRKVSHWLVLCPLWFIDLIFNCYCLICSHPLFLRKGFNRKKNVKFHNFGPDPPPLKAQNFFLKKSMYSRQLSKFSKYICWGFPCPLDRKILLQIWMN